MKILNKKAISIIEFTLLFIIIIGALLVMSKYIQNGIFGNWARSGQSMAYGRQYDPQKTIDCAFDEVSNKWYDRNCFKFRQCSLGDVTCEVDQCQGSGCNQLNNGQSL